MDGWLISIERGSLVYISEWLFYNEHVVHFVIELTNDIHYDSYISLSKLRHHNS